MARSFSSASSQYLSYGSAWVAAEPLTMACWFNPTSDTVAQTLMSICDTDAANSFSLNIGSGASDSATATTTASGSGAAAVTLNRITPNAWNHAAAVFTSSSNRSIFVNNNTASNALSRVVSGLDTSYIAAQHNGTSLSNYFNGLIAECAIWSAALTTNEIKALWKGRSPLTIRRQALIAYYPLGGFQGQSDRDFWRSGLTLSSSNSPTWGDHPRVVHVPVYGGLKVTYSTSVPITLTADVVTAVSSLIVPSLSAGGLTLSSPTLAGTASAITPAYSLGAVSVSPVVINALAENLTPVFSFGELTLSGPVVTGLSSAITPTYSLGALSIVPDTITAIAESLTPVFSFSSLTINVPIALASGAVSVVSITPQPLSLEAPLVDSSASIVDCSVQLSGVSIATPVVECLGQVSSPDIFIINPVQWDDGGLSLVTTSLTSFCRIATNCADVCSLILVSEKLCSLV